MTGVAHEMRRVDADLGQCPHVLALEVGIEHEIEIGRAVQPAVGLDLAFELTRRPARIAERKDGAVGPSPEAMAFRISIDAVRLTSWSIGSVDSVT